MAVEAPRLEAEIGMEVYASKGRGIGGRIRCSPEDFIVEEILVDGSKASVKLAKEPVALPSGNGRYLMCILVKRNWDTLVAVGRIAGRLGISPERISIAGIKDANALTAQHISIGWILPQKVVGADLKGMALRPIRFIEDEVSSRILFGNQFAATVRVIRYMPSTVRRRIETVRAELVEFGGMPNFFGHQRFGTVRPITHCVGRCIVKGNFEEAVFTFLAQPSRHEHPESREARRLLRDTGNFNAALRHFPKSLMYERLMLRHLSRHQRDYSGALRRLPPKLFSLLVQAYQSFLFNRFLSERMRRGLPLSEALLGDYAVDLDEKGLALRSFSKVDKQNISEVNGEILRGRMAVAIPLVGFKQSPSGGIQGEVEGEILEAEEIVPQDFRIQKMAKASAAGGLRTALCQLRDLNIEESSSTDQDGLSARFSFTLHKSSYATVLLREFMKPREPLKAGY